MDVQIPRLVRRWQCPLSGERYQTAGIRLQMGRIPRGHRESRCASQHPALIYEPQSDGNDLVLQQLIFPGVGAFGQAVTALREKGFAEPLTRYIKSGKP